MQAICRSHRLGQKKAVTATRFITKDSIEARMLELQKKKSLVFEGTIDSSAAALSQLTSDDLNFCSVDRPDVNCKTTQITSV